MDLPRQGRHGLNGPGTPCSFHDLLHFHLTVACVEAENPPVEAVVTDRLHNADDVGVNAFTSLKRQIVREHRSEVRQTQK